MLNREQYYVLVLGKKTKVYKLSGATVPLLKCPLSASLSVTRHSCTNLFLFFIKNAKLNQTTTVKQVP